MEKKEWAFVLWGKGWVKVGVGGKALERVGRGRV